MSEAIQKPNEELFEKKAAVILNYLKRDLRYGTEIPRPFFVEFTGSPSAGKTTTIIELDKFLRRCGFRVYKPLEGAEQIRHIERTTPLYNLRTGLYALELLIDLSHGHMYDVVIFDRCIFDAYVWMMYWQDKGLLEDKEKTGIQKFFLSRFWADSIDAAYFMVCDPEEAIRREQRIALTSKLGETTNPASVRTLVKRYRNAFDRLVQNFPQLTLIDTSSSDEQGMVDKIALDLLNRFELKAQKERENPSEL
ncbi:MAG: hypothetical protein Q7S36_01880 [Candidatus Liptonbacteria bacterium]|nr:hypothetical protein [Candidatus Liptonbacteria bacterium]